ncbi:hypothetical protein LXA43DRAFT_968728 [Ganoderma leucocontextum]|nr:hypothetical protein LXA43DRAFT_968728 [Ganoderma leucocontextum]
MNRRKRGGNNNLKPPAQTKPSPSSVASSPAAPATVPPMPPRVSPPPKATTPSQNVPPPSKPTQPAIRVGPQPPRLSASPPKPPVPSMPPAKTAIPPSRPGPPQKRVLTRSDRVRAVWIEFIQVWVASKQDEVAKQLEQLLHAAERNTRVRGKALEDSKDKIVNSKRREFALAARAEWERRLGKEGLEAEDWSDIRPEEMAAVEQVLSCDEGDDQPVASMMVPPHEQVAPSLSPKVAAEASHSMASHPAAGRPAQPSPPAATQKIPQAPPPAAAQKGKQTHGQPAWAAWGPGPRHVSVTEVPEEPQKTASAWTARQNAPIIEDIRVSPKAAPAPPPPQTSQPASRPAQPAPPAEPATTFIVPAHGLLVYPVPISLKTTPLDSAVASDSHFVHLVDNAYVNSIKEFHNKAADVDAALARELRKPMPPAEREWTIRAHMMTMEQIARTIVENRDTMIENARRKRGYSGDGHGGAPPPSAPKATVSSQPPGAFPDDGIHISPVEREPEVEIEREPAPDVDEVIEIPLKGKAARKKGKKVGVTNGRSTAAPAISSTTKAAAPAAKPAVIEKPTPVVEKPVPVVEKKLAPVASAWGWGAKVVPPMRSASPAPRAASPAPIHTRVVPTPAPAPTGRGKGCRYITAAEPQAKPPSSPNGMWAPPVARTTSNKNPFAPTRPSRLAQVSEPESPEPPSPPPIPAEPTGKDYVAWFAGSSSEDEDAGLSEGDDGDDEDDSGSDPQGAGPGGIGGILGALAGASPWALFGAEGAQPQKERGGRAPNHHDRGRGVAATPAPAMAAAGRFGGDMGMGMGMGMGPGPATGGGWTQWAADAGAGPSGFRHGAAPAGSGGLARGPAGPQWPVREEDNLEDMLELASKTLNRAAGGQARGGGVNIEEAMAMYVTAQKARETLATPVGGRSATPWGRR